MKRFIFLIATFLVINNLFSQSELVRKIEFSNSSIKSEKLNEVSSELKFLFIDNCFNKFENNFLPSYEEFFQLPISANAFNYKIKSISFQDLSAEEAIIFSSNKNIGSEIKISTNIAYEKKKPIASISIIPLRINQATGKLERINSIEIEIIPEKSNSVSHKKSATSTYATTSVLATGTWYKVGCVSSGIYKIDYNFLKKIGVDVASVNPQNIRIYGNGGGLLSEKNADPKMDDLKENSIYVSGESDGILNSNDYVLFYGMASTKFKYNNSDGLFHHELHRYSDTTYYFINVDLGMGKRVNDISHQQASSSLTETHLVTSYDDYVYHEKENINFIKSGRNSFGEFFDQSTPYSFPLTVSNIDLSSPVYIKSNIAGRNNSSACTFKVQCQSGSVIVTDSGTNTNDYLSPYANEGSGNFTFNPSSGNLQVSITKLTSTAQGWLDYIEWNFRRKFSNLSSYFCFRDINSVGAGNIAHYQIQSAIPLQIWDVTDPADAKEQQTTFSSGLIDFKLPSDSLKEFLAFDGTSFLTPVFHAEVANQNLHASAPMDLIIVSHPLFLNQAQKLANLHQTDDGLRTIVVTPQEIYNEFSSGIQDVSAIRNFIKMFYDRAGTNTADLPKYLLLFGDGSYNNKARDVAGNTNFVPTYQSYNSTAPLLSSYTSDDYYGFLDDDEGPWLDTSDRIDIGIGRLPVQSTSEADVIVNKILHYVSDSPVDYNQSSLISGSVHGDWRTMVTFIGDDEDGDMHMNQANSLAAVIETKYKTYNIDKILLDAYKQEITPGGQRYPDAEEAFKSRVEKGSLIINYTGHGGELGLAHERLLEVSDINNWTNYNKLFFMVTASCEVTRYDDPGRTSAGEYAFLNPNGGAIALMSTSRTVYASQNFTLNNNFYKYAFEPISGEMPRLGDIYEATKNSMGTDLNSRNFSLVGDPALKLAYPKYNVKTDSINGATVSSDTLRALSKVTITGRVLDNSGSTLTNYNGVVYPTVFDKSQNITTLSNDVGSPKMTFKLQNNILFKGKVEVKNGLFSFSFIVPKDINYTYGYGKISYYAYNGADDAAGYMDTIVVGGYDTTQISDNQAPDVKLYMNDSKFVFGGMTNENPKIFATVNDLSGINTVGNGIGHDIVAVLDNNTENAFVLNDYYETDLNSYQSGKIYYPLSNLTEGKHTLSLKVWDVNNNSAQDYTEFVVAKSAEVALSHVLNYPNPFTTKTSFYFEHNQASENLNVQIQIFTVAGKLVKTIAQRVNSDGFRSDAIDWDGRDDFGDKLARGVYIYRIKLIDSKQQIASKYEKLVILK